jgi:ribonuclease Z
VIGPTWIKFWLSEHSECENIHFSFINAAELVETETETNTILSNLKKECGIDKMVAVEVIHCPFSYGLVVQHQKSQFKLVYSGDTRPSEDLVKFGKGAHLLIHEATFEPNMVK